MNKTYEEGYIAGFNHNIEVVKELEEQQQKFINFLENEKLLLCQGVSHIYEDSLGKRKYVNADIFKKLDEVLSEYKEIIGSDNNE